MITKEMIEMNKEDAEIIEEGKEMTGPFANPTDLERAEYGNNTYEEFNLNGRALI